jgi:XFP N-terminal domain
MSPLTSFGSCPAFGLRSTIIGQRDRSIEELPSRMLLNRADARNGDVGHLSISAILALAESDRFDGQFANTNTQSVRSSFSGLEADAMFHKGGKLGYALAQSCGAALDNANSIVACRRSMLTQV